MLIELESDNRASVRRMFNHYPCCHGGIAATIEGGMGKVFVDSQEIPSVALAVLDFHFLAGDPSSENAPFLINLLQHGERGEWVIAPTPDWQHLLTANYSGELEVYQREAFLAEQFDVDKLQCLCQALPSGFELRKVCLEEVTQFASNLSPALIHNFRSHEDFISRGVGIGIWHQGMLVSGASSAAVGGGKLEFEIQTHPRFRRRGLARVVAAALIIYCIEHDLEPCWDAANEPSSALARQLGFHSTGKYDAYWLDKPELESVAH